MFDISDWPDSDKLCTACLRPDCVQYTRTLPSSRTIVCMNWKSKSSLTQSRCGKRLLAQKHSLSTLDLVTHLVHSLCLTHKGLEASGKDDSNVARTDATASVAGDRSVLKTRIVAIAPSARPKSPKPLIETACNESHSVCLCCSVHRPEAGGVFRSGGHALPGRAVGINQEAGRQRQRSLPQSTSMQRSENEVRSENKIKSQTKSQRASASVCQISKWNNVRDHTAQRHHSYRHRTQVISKYDGVKRNFQIFQDYSVCSDCHLPHNIPNEGDWFQKDHCRRDYVYWASACETWCQLNTPEGLVAVCTLLCNWHLRHGTVTWSLSHSTSCNCHADTRPFTESCFLELN